MPNSSSPEPPAVSVFTIFLPSYEDAVKCSPEPPPYEQALTDVRLDDLECSPLPSNRLPPHSRIPNGPRSHNQTTRQTFYKYFCWIIAITVVLLLAYIVYLSISRTGNGTQGSS